MTGMTKIKIQDELKTKDILAVTMPKKDYAKHIASTVSALSKAGSKITYVSVNKPYNALLKLFKDNSIEPKEVCVIDCVTATVAKKQAVTKKEECLYFISSPKNLTEISLNIGDVIKKTDMVFVDAVSTFMIYEKSVIVLRFVHDLINKLRLDNKKGVFVILKDDKDDDLLDDLSMFVDGTVEIE
jgi:hypothetical protein